MVCEKCLSLWLNPTVSVSEALKRTISESPSLLRMMIIYGFPLSFVVIMAVRFLVSV